LGPSMGNSGCCGVSLRLAAIFTCRAHHSLGTTGASIPVHVQLAHPHLI